MKPLFASLFLLSVALLPAQQRAEFEVASVKPSGTSRGHIGWLVYPGGRVDIGHATLEMLIECAFDVQSFQISAGPVWMRDPQFRYQIEAIPPSTSKSSQLNPSTPKAPLSEEQRQMLQSLLMDRFQLQFHHETRQGPVYLLTLGKGDLKLKEVKHESEFEWVGSVAGAAINGDGLAGRNISMPVLAQRLGDYLKKPVFDQTGINGYFDFKIDYAPGEAQPDIVSCIVTSLQGLGLKLKPSQGPVDTIVIDHAEKASPN